MDSISKKFLIMDNLAKAMEPLDTRVQGMVQHSTSTIFFNNSCWGICQVPDLE